MVKQVSAVTLMKRLMKQLKERNSALKCQVSTAMKLDFSHAEQVVKDGGNVREYRQAVQHFAYIRAGR